MTSFFWQATPGDDPDYDRIADGMLVEKWPEKDMLSLLQQIGVMPRLTAP